MNTLELTGKETAEELMILMVDHFGLMSGSIVAEVITKASQQLGGIKGLVDTQIRAQETSNGAMVSHFLFYAISTLPPEDQTCLIDNIAEAAGLIKDPNKGKPLIKKTPLIYLPGKGGIN